LPRSPKYKEEKDERTHMFGTCLRTQTLGCSGQELKRSREGDILASATAWKVQLQ
jgi:hypothetical protein